MKPEDVKAMADEVSRLLALRLGASGHGLEARVASRARTLPREVRRAALELALAEARAHAPKLARQLDARAVERAYKTCRDYLEPLGASARLRSGVLGTAASVAFVLLVALAGALAVAKMRGLI